MPGRVAPGWWVVRGGPEHQSLVARARHARARGLKRKLPWVPNHRGWIALFSLADDGPHRVGDVTVPGATISHNAVRALAKHGLVVREGMTVSLTDEGRARVERKW